MLRRLMVRMGSDEKQRCSIQVAAAKAEPRAKLAKSMMVLVRWRFTSALTVPGVVLAGA
jgi:hypothetical protein